MNIEHINKQLLKSPTWTDETGMEIQTKRLTKLEKLKEVKSYQLMKEAFVQHEKLKAFKIHVKKECQLIYETQREELARKSKKEPKGNFTWHNFDQTIKIEVSVSESISFDDLLINECKALLDEFIQDDIDSKSGFGKEMVTDAFSTRNGKLDSKKVMSLLKWKEKIKADKYQAAMEILQRSIRRPKSRTYFRVSIKDLNGKYQAIDLNLSSINE